MNLRALPDFRLEVYLGKWEFAAKHHLTASDAESSTITAANTVRCIGSSSHGETGSAPGTVAEILALEPGADRRLLDLRLQYVPTWGTDELRAAVAATYDTLGPRDVLAFAGAEEALFWALAELVGPGDHAIVTVPNYQSMESVPLATGASVSGLMLRPENGFAPDPDELVRMLQPNTKLVCLNFPNNPTGVVPQRDDWETIVRACDTRGVRVFSDEVYRGLERDPARTLRQAADLSDRALSLNVVSKAYGLPGLRVGWLASRDRELLDRLERRKHYTSICNAGPSELLAAIALRHHRTLKGRCREVLTENIERAKTFFEGDARFAFSPPDGGSVCFPRYLGADGVEAFTEGVLREEGVVLLPASIYSSQLGTVPVDRFRLGLGRRDFADGLSALG
jgi:aspartate/methionine/tyrosine aminotransferase